MLDRDTLTRALLMSHTLELGMSMGRVCVTLKREGWTNTQLLPMDHHMDSISEVVNWQIDKSLKEKQSENND